MNDPFVFVSIFVLDSFLTHLILLELSFIPVQPCPPLLASRFCPSPHEKYRSACLSLYSGLAQILTDCLVQLPFSPLRHSASCNSLTGQQYNDDEYNNYRNYWKRPGDGATATRVMALRNGTIRRHDAGTPVGEPGLSIMDTLPYPPPYPSL